MPAQLKVDYIMAVLYESGKYDYGGSRPIRDHNNGAGWGSISYDEDFIVLVMLLFVIC